jgi:hypothetical protein
MDRISIDNRRRLAAGMAEPPLCLPLAAFFQEASDEQRTTSKDPKGCFDRGRQQCVGLCLDCDYSANAVIAIDLVDHINADFFGFDQRGKSMVKVAGATEVIELDFHRRQMAYEIARDAWIESNGNKDVAVAIARERLRNRVGLSPIVIEAIILLIINIIDKWIDNQVSLPSIVPSSDVPGFGEDCPCD